ncbi:ExeA family protein [Marinobacter xestospongiae]|uniref:ExeA family protein n=1 Tax=Marinobacter xestospongiae TaxID=994319 RepID=UPI0020030B58|nr:AAA family ATPase [Marinobacter xestospongiae]MCK7566138.1 AAA family ATPase [Marinobacter xestospongiae]
MYYDFFGFREPPFSIAPDPRYLYLSDRHKEALAHLMYGVGGQGGFIVITGEVGTGKTTVSRCFIDNAPDNVDMAIILNPRLSARELLSSVCDELGIRHPAGSSIKRLVDLINEDLLKAYAAGRHKVLLIDEAQNLSSEVLEQLRLLTNLETAEKKLLQIILLGQPELNDMLSLPELRQLNQRVTARYHLDALQKEELPSYLQYRLSVAGQRGELFSRGAIQALYKLSGGVPRLINLVSDRALLGAYAEGEHLVTREHIRTAAREVTGPDMPGRRQFPRKSVFAALAVVVLAIAVSWGLSDRERRQWLTSPYVAQAAGDSEPEVSGSDPGEAEGQGAADVDGADGNESAEAQDTAQSDQAAPVGDLAEPAALAPFRFDTDALSKVEAFQALFQQWGERYTPSDFPVACEFGRRQGLGCLHREGTRRSLLQIDRPTILRLRDGNRERYVTLVSLRGDEAQLRLADGEIRTVSFRELEDFWYGDFSVLWRLPPYLGDNDSTSKEIWLSSQLMQLADLHAASDRERVEVQNMGPEQQVEWYQGIKGLQVDGIPGAMTLIQINNDLHPGVPRLANTGAEG